MSWIFLLSLLLTITTTSAVGVTYTVADAPPKHLATILRRCGITAVRLRDPPPEIIRSFANSNISMLIEIPNDLIPSASILWLYNRVAPFYRHVSAVSIDGSSVNKDLLLPALQNIYASLQLILVNPSISVSPNFDVYEVITNIFPPSAARFGEMIENRLLMFLAESNSPLLVKFDPYHALTRNPQFPVDFALFTGNYTYTDDVSGIRYNNLFDVMVDSVTTSMAASGYSNIPVVVTESEWTGSNASEEINLYQNGLFRHVNSGTRIPGLAMVYYRFDVWVRGCGVGAFSLAKLPHVEKVDLGGGALLWYLGIVVMSSIFVVIIFAGIFDTITYPTGCPNPWIKVTAQYSNVRNISFPTKPPNVNSLKVVCVKPLEPVLKRREPVVKQVEQDP